MTDPDPHSFVLSRRARRDTGRRPTDAAPKPPAGATRRGLREPAPRSGHVDSAATARRAPLAPHDELASPTSTVASTTRRTAAQQLAEPPLLRTPVESPSSTPVCGAVTHRPEPSPARVQSASPDVRVPVEELPGGAEWSPIWAAITRTPASGASASHPASPPETRESPALSAETDTATSQTTSTAVAPSARPDAPALEKRAEPPAADDATTSPAAPSQPDPSAEVVRFVMPPPRPKATARSGIPPILRPPPPAVSARLEPLLPADPPIRHARRRPRKPLRLGMAATAAAAAAALVLGGSVGVTAAVTGTPVSIIARNVVVGVAAMEPSTPAASPVLPPSRPAAAAPTESPSPAVTPVPAAVDPCTAPGTVAALQAGDDAAAIAAMGGADALRAAVATAGAPCIDLGDPARVWVVVDKTRPLDPIDYAPASLSAPAGVRSLEGGELREDAAAAMSAMVSAAAQAGVGEIAVLSAYRSYDTQVTSFGNQVSDRGAESAELVSARPGYSEHQSGLAADIVPCDGECGTLDDLAGSAQGQWVAAHAWEFGWIVRYEAGHTGVTGYSPEAWHLRYIGVQLAAAYHAGGWHTLEEFFALPAAPDYVD